MRKLCGVVQLRLTYPLRGAAEFVFSLGDVQVICPNCIGMLHAAKQEAVAMLQQEYNHNVADIS